MSQVVPPTETPGVAEDRPRRPYKHRTEGREVALKYLFGADLRGVGQAEGLEEFLVHQEVKGETALFARGLIEGALAHQSRIDPVISELAKNWRIGRMSAVDRNILRLGCYELLFAKQSPPRVVINEAIELAKKFGSAQSGAFVNGILDKVGKRPAPCDPRPEGDSPCSAS